jgi:RNA-directed DNA polymerase
MTQTNKHILANDPYQLMEKVVEYNNMKTALDRVEKNKGAPGIDGMKTDELGKYLKINWRRIKQELLAGTYKPSPVRQVEIPKQDGGMRKLGIPTVLDRLIQQAIQQVLTPIFEPTFSKFSYGFRPGKSARQAVYQAQRYIKDGKKIVVDTDIEKFFDRVNHDILMTKVAKHVFDQRMHILIRRYLQAGALYNGCCVATDEGTPQGGPISPLLSNIMLNQLDHELMKRNLSFVRYADDCNIYVSSKRAGQRVYASIKRWLETQLKLKINEVKSAVDIPGRRRFLGFTFTTFEEVRLCVAPKTIKRFKEQIRKLTRRNESISMEERLRRLNTYILGWSGYFGIADMKSRFKGLDEWIRRRLRMCLLKQWKRCKTKLKSLMSLGIPEKWAGCVAYSRKQYWRLAKTPQVSKALGNAYWKEQGLRSLFERYEKMHISI